MADESRFELFSYWRTSATYRVRVALNLKGLTAKETNIDIDKGEQRSPSFLKVNPMGAIPALLDREETSAPLTQSLAILEFLDELVPTPALLPADVHQRARVRSLAAMLAGDTHPLITPRIKRYLLSEGRFDDAMWRQWQIQWFTTGLQAFENRLQHEPGTGMYCHGDQVTQADICLASILVVMRVFKIPVDDIPIITQIMARLETLPAFVAADPNRQMGAPGNV
jgi:maleylacetoacetate isomerase